SPLAIAASAGNTRPPFPRPQRPTPMTSTAPTRLPFAPGDLRGAEAIDDDALITAIGQVETAWIIAKARVRLVSSEVRTEVAAAFDATLRSLSADHAELHTTRESAE